MPLRQPTRWAIVTHLIERGAPNADALLAAEVRARHDDERQTQRVRRRRGATGSARTRQRTSIAISATATLNEDWATASLRAFNAGDQSSLTLPYLVPALDSLQWIQKNRRIFFLGSWLGGFIGGQQSPRGAWHEIDAFLAKRPKLPPDLRQKILQTRDDLERTVKIRAKFAAGKISS